MSRVKSHANQAAGSRPITTARALGNSPNNSTDAKAHKLVLSSGEIIEPPETFNVRQLRPGQQVTISRENEETTFFATQVTLTKH